MSAQFEDKHGLKFFLIFWNMHLGSMTSERGCSVQTHLWLRKEDRGQVVLETKCAARNLGISI